MKRFKNIEMHFRILNLLYHEGATYKEADEIIESVQSSLKIDRLETEYEYYTKNGETNTRFVGSANNKPIREYKIITAEEFENLWEMTERDYFITSCNLF